jgi:hypothetical protein
MEALIFEILVTSAATLFAMEKYTQISREKSQCDASKKVPSNENIRVINLKYVSVPVPTRWSLEGLLNWDNRIESAAEIELVGSCVQVEFQVRECLNALKAKRNITEGNTLICQLNSGIFSSSRMIKIEFTEIGNNRCKLHVEASIYDTDFLVRKDKIIRRDEYNLQAFVTLLNASSVSTAKLVCDVL